MTPKRRCLSLVLLVYEFFIYWLISSMIPWATLTLFKNFFHYSKMVLVAIQDDGSNFISPAITVLKRLGATDPILTNFRGSFAFVGYAQANRPTGFAQEQNNARKGPSEIKLKIPLTQNQPSKDMLFAWICNNIPSGNLGLY